MLPCHFFGGPDATTRPPSSPAPGPRSMTQSRRDTHVVLDHDHGIAGFDEPVELTMSLSTSAGCRPVVGSSRT